MLMGLCSLSMAQTQFWYDDFESATSPSSGTRTPENNGGNFDAYFRRATNADIGLSTISDGDYSNFQGTYFWAGEDHDGAFGTGNEEQQITWTGIDISGMSDLSFKGLFGAQSTNGTFDNTVFGNSHTDYIIVEYSIDGGAYSQLIAFYSKNLSEKFFFEDTDGDQLGDGGKLTKSFSEFTKPISGTGNTLSLRLRAYSNNTYSEEWAVDNFRVLGTQACSMSASFTSQTNVGCNGSNQGALTIQQSNGTGNFKYVWSNGSQTTNTSSSTNSIGNLSAGTYSCIITDANGCTATASATITEPTVFSASVGSQTNISCKGGDDGSATVNVSGGMKPYSYSWSPSGGTSATASNLSAGNYTCTITDDNGCSATRSVTITEPTVLSASVGSQTNVSCHGGDDGSVTVNVSGGVASYTYAWSPSVDNSSNSVGNLSAGKYVCIVMDANGCSVNKSVTITEPTALQAEVSSHSNVSCNGASDGEATVTASEGTAPYTYSWSPLGKGSVTASGLSEGTYTCMVTDANGCSVEESVTITEPEAMNLLVTENEMGLSADLQGADAYQWLDCSNESEVDGEISGSFEPAVDGIYAVEITLDGCVDTSNCIEFEKNLVAIENQLEENSTLKAYPNPISEGQLNFSMPLHQVVVYNAFGVVVHQRAEAEALEITNFESGVYFVKAEEGVIRFVVK